ncbi:DUF378 domain-containing protein [Clostridium sp. SHJSY1]|uniref:DUF378 domain-containing protein n=1 Tax=Clostridium sp. SHJSY1 TaxID=2942483 RepID=UPI00287464D9|nr:DUF378 domain-containing protein [Clostridium sp. SHJSY1]MDS0527389.1 DUF378 domain-containing protein [Clostridium sp. SHJSY1]
MYKLNLWDKISFVLCIIGSINWGFIGLFNINLFSIITVNIIMLQRIIYIIILLSSINLVYTFLRCFFNFDGEHIKIKGK